MVATIQANKVSFSYLEDNFHLQRHTDEQFFTEWLTDLPELSSEEKTALDQIKNNYLYLAKDESMLEIMVKMVVISPLLSLAGFFQHPFKVSAEQSVELSVQDRDEIIKGDLDILVVQNQFWVLIIEAKRPKISLDACMAQTLAYMLANPSDKPSFALLTNGSNFMFFKLIKQDIAYYDVSNLFSLFNRGNDLYTVLRVIKHIGQIIIT